MRRENDKRKREEWPSVTVVVFCGPDFFDSVGFVRFFCQVFVLAGSVFALISTNIRNHFHRCRMNNWTMCRSPAIQQSKNNWTSRTNVILHIARRNTKDTNFATVKAPMTKRVARRTGTLIGHAGWGLCGPLLCSWLPRPRQRATDSLFFTVRGGKEKRKTKDEVRSDFSTLIRRASRQDVSGRIQRKEMKRSISYFCNLCKHVQKTSSHGDMSRKVQPERRPAIHWHVARTTHMGAYFHNNIQPEVTFFLKAMLAEDQKSATISALAWPNAGWPPFTAGAAINDTAWGPRRTYHICEANVSFLVTTLPESERSSLHWAFKSATTRSNCVRLPTGHVDTQQLHVGNRPR